MREDIPTSFDLFCGESAVASGVVAHEDARPKEAGEAEIEPDLSVLLVGLLAGLLALKMVEPPLLVLMLMLRAELSGEGELRLLNDGCDLAW